MSVEDHGQDFNALRGFLNGEEPEEEIYFAHSASLRIFGVIPDLSEITRQLGIEPTSSHRCGDRKGPKSPPFSQDMWRFKSPVDETEPLMAHIDCLWNQIRDRKDFLLQLKKQPNVTVDVFLGYRSNCDHAGVEVPASSLEMFVELGIPFGLSIIIA